MEQAIRRALDAARADYTEMRIQEARTTRVAYTGRELEDIGESTDLGGSVRALVKGAWGFAAFNDIAELPRYVRMACDQARLIGGGDARLAPVPPSRDRAVLAEGVDPSTVPLADKRELCARYNDLILAAPKVQTSSVRYRDSHSATYFASSEGHFIVQEVVFCGVIMVAVAKDGADVQQAFHSVGDLRGYGNVLGLEAQCEEIAKRAGDLLSAKSVEGGKYTVVIDPRLCGVFAHEAFGHLSEADFVYENKKLREIMQLGKRFGPDTLAIVDDGAMKGGAGTMAYDSEGTRTQKTYLIRDGVLVGRLHSRATAAKMGEPPTGNARALGYSFEPIVRMTNTYMEPRDWSFERMLETTDEGIYAIGSIGGSTNNEMFTFAAEQAFAIRGSKLAEPLRDVVLTGNVFETLASIDAIGKDLQMHGGLGGCGKGGQSPLRVSDGGPHVRIRNVVVGGR